MRAVTVGLAVLFMGAVLGAQPPTVGAGADALGWLAGSWGGQSGTLTMEEHWTSPAGGMLLGMHRDVRGDRAVSFEFMRIESREGTLTFMASPRGAAPTPFPLKEHGAQRVVFENTAHDFPQRIIYWREGDALRARVEGMVKGKLESEEWTWTRLRNP